jgi:hypothetical protein
MSKHFVGDMVWYRWPHPTVRRVMWSYLRSWWKPRWYRCDPVCCDFQKGPHKHFTWVMLAREWKRLLFRGMWDTRYD